MILCLDQQYKLVSYNGHVLLGRNNAIFWVFTQIKDGLYTIVDIQNMRFLSMNLLTKTVITLPYLPCSSTTQFSVQRLPNRIYWVISTVLDNVTYVFSQLSFNPISTPIDVYVPSFYEKWTIILGRSKTFIV